MYIVHWNKFLRFLNLTSWYIAICLYQELQIMQMIVHCIENLNQYMMSSYYKMICVYSNNGRSGKCRFNVDKCMVLSVTQKRFLYKENISCTIQNLKWQNPLNTWGWKLTPVIFNQHTNNTCKKLTHCWASSEGSLGTVHAK